MKSLINTFKDKALTLLHAKGGEAIRWAVAGSLGWLFTWLTQKGIVIPEDKQLAAQVAISGFLLYVLNEGIQWYQNTQAKKLQSTLNDMLPAKAEVKEDGWIGPETVSAVVKAIAVD